MSFYSSVPVVLFINVSSSEGVPVSIMEAMSFGIPVMATDAGGTSELVSEKTGLLINIDIAPQELAYKIEELISRPDLSKLRRGAREIWENKSMADKVYPAFINHLLFV
jgi:glycosyltransferase involved in cell wall biosynthesis